MIPKKLTIQGLYAYKTRQEIDFESLTSNQIFGIFGQVGSGKSSILDAITFALYHEIERINKTENRALNLFNKESNSFFIEFEFVTGNNLFRFVASNKRKKNGDPESFSHQAYQWENQDWNPLGNMTAESILQLNYQNFRRTIIIPQGKFQEFFALTGGDRTNMMMELFPRLSEFDLFDRVATKLNETKLELADLQGQLKQLGELDPAEIQIQNDQILNLEKAIEQSEKVVSDLTKKLEEIKEIQLWQSELEKAQKRLQELEPQEEEMTRKKEQLTEYERIVKVFGTPFQLLEKARTDFAQMELKLSASQVELSSQMAHFQKMQENLSNVEPQRKSISILEAQLLDWEHVVKILALEKEKGVKAAAMNKLDEQIQQFQKEKEYKFSQRESLENVIETLESQLPDISKMLEAYNLLKEKQGLQSDLESFRQRLQQNEERMEDWRRKKEQILDANLQSKFLEFRPELKIKELLEALVKIKKDLADGIGALQRRKEEILGQDHLFTYASQIKEGLPCPLCGSTHHPHIINADDVSLLKAENEIQLKEKSDLLTALSPLEGHLIQIQTEVKNLLREKEQLDHQIETTNSKLAINQEKSTDNEWVLHGLEYIQSNLLKEKNIQSELKSNRELAKKCTDSLKEVESKLAGLEKDKGQQGNFISSWEGKILAHREQIKSLPLTEWKNMDQGEAEIRMEDLGHRIQELKAEVELAEVKLDLAKNKLLANQTTAKDQEELLEVLNNDLSRQEEIFQEQLRIHQTAEGNVKERLAEIWDVPSVRNHLDVFFQEVRMARQKIADAKTKMVGLKMDENQESETIENLRIAKEMLANLQIDLGTQKAEWKRLNDNLKKGLEIRNRANQVSLRKENLDILYRLFINKGFVGYASSRYLNNIVEMANERFFKMTRQRLRLTLDDKNNFMVRDYLNNGHERLAKTLSGGQIFQASLCLALALADSIGHLSQNAKNFFFLDEGFGSLDKDSLSMVFETLRQLKNENRIIGIISHVEELQQEMPVFLQVKMTAEKGSVIEWNG